MEAESSKPSFWSACYDSTPRDRRNLRRIAWTVGLWAAASITAKLLITREVLPEGTGRWAVAAVPVLLAVPVLIAYARFLRDGDELQRVIQTQALALGFGGTFFAVTGYSLAERAGAPPLDRGDLLLVMGLLYALGSYLGWRRYR